MISDPGRFNVSFLLCSFAVPAVLLHRETQYFSRQPTVPGPHRAASGTRHITTSHRDSFVSQRLIPEGSTAVFAVRAGRVQAFPVPEVRLVIRTATALRRFPVPVHIRRRLKQLLTAVQLRIILKHWLAPPYSRGPSSCRS